jgi:pre-mRNA-splicing factor CDC5/CEF1
LAINANGDMVGMTPRDQKNYQNSIKQQLRAGFAALPKPKEIELEEPEEPEEEELVVNGHAVESEEDASERDRRIRAQQEAEAAAELKRRSQAVQRDLPRPSVVDIDALMETASKAQGIDALIAEEMALLIGSDALRYPVKGGKVNGAPSRMLDRFEDELIERARMETLLEFPSDAVKDAGAEFEEAWHKVHGGKVLPGLEEYGDDEIDEEQLMSQAFDVSFFPPIGRSI